MSVHHALRITGLATVINFALSLGSSIVVARLLTPGEIGIFSIAVTLVSFGHMLRDFGVGQYLIKQSEVTRQDLRACFSVMLLTSWSVAGAMVLLAPLAARFYHQPGIGDVFRVLALNFAALPFGAYILSMLKREMAFGKVALVNIAGVVVNTAVTLVCAWRGASYMSMAWGSLAGVLATTVALSLARPSMALLLPTRHGLGPVLRFGGTASLANVLSRLSQGGPDLVLGRTMSVAAVAHFNRAGSLLTMLSGQINDVLLQVFGPAFAKGLREGQSPAVLLGRAIESNAGLQMPLVLMLALLSQPTILFLFGPQWQEAADIAPWITLWAVLSVPTQLAYSALTSGGHARAVLRASAVSSAVLLLVLLMSLVLSLEQLAHAMLLFRAITLWAWVAELARHYQFGWRCMWNACRRSATLSLLTVAPAGAVAALLALLWPEASPLLRIIAVGSTGTLAYLALLRWGRYPIRDDLVKLAPPLGLLLGAR